MLGWCYKYIRLLKLKSQNKEKNISTTPESQLSLENTANPTWACLFTQHIQRARRVFMRDLAQTRFFLKIVVIFCQDYDASLISWLLAASPGYFLGVTGPGSSTCSLHLLWKTAGCCTGLEDTHKVTRGSGPPDLQAVLQQLHELVCSFHCYHQQLSCPFLVLVINTWHMWSARWHQFPYVKKNFCLILSLILKSPIDVFPPCNVFAPYEQCSK